MVAIRSGGVGPMPLKCAKLPSPCRKKRSIGIMRSMALLSCRRRRDVARLERLPQRQEIEQQLDQRAGIAADVAAVGQDLPVELVGDELL